MLDFTGFRRAFSFAVATAAMAALLQGCAGPQKLAHSRELVRDGDAVIDVIVDGTGPAIVLLPSSIRDSEDFDALAQLIARQGFKVLRPQPRGMHGSTGATQGLTLNLLAQDVALAVEKLGGGRAVLVGHAYGHFVARVADLNFPQRVRGVVVLGAAQKDISQTLLAALAVGSNPERPREERLKALQLAMFAPGNDPSSWLEGWYPRLLPAYRAAAQVPDKNAWWPVANAPILDLQGTEDPWRPPSSRDELKAVLGDKVTVKLIERASHALVPEQPAAVASAIVDWVRTLKP